MDYYGRRWGEGRRVERHVEPIDEMFRERITRCPDCSEIHMHESQCRPEGAYVVRVRGGTGFFVGDDHFAPTLAKALRFQERDAADCAARMLPFAADVVAI